MHNNSIYVGLSSLVTLERQLNSIAHNLANISTAGFRARGVKFDTLVSSKASGHVNFASVGKSFISTAPGPVIETGNPFDIAIQGDVWMSVETPHGPIYTRDGRMKMLPDGDLVTMQGNPVLDASGAPLVLQPDAGAPEISPDGAIYQNGQHRGAIGLYILPEKADLLYAGNSGVVANMSAEAVVDDVSAGIRQGMIEGSNVDSVTEMTRLISVSRTFEQVNNLLAQQENSLSEAIKTLGARTG